MPMRGELPPLALRTWWSDAEDEETWRQLRDAFNSLDPVAVIFSGIGLLATFSLALLYPSTASELAAVVAQVF